MSPPSGCQDSAAADTARRRNPRQQRGRDTVDALLEATALLLDEVGYEALTTKEIAARARVSIGSFYQFFENKDAALDELVRGYRARIHSFLADAVSRSPAGGLSVAWTQDMIAGLAEIYRNLPGFGGVWGGRFAEGPLDAQAKALRQEVFDALDEALAGVFPHVGVEARKRCLTMTLETAALLLGHADRVLVHGELHRMLGLYLASYFVPR